MTLRTAYHEAGHAVVGMAKGNVPLYLFVNGEDGGCKWREGSKRDVAMAVAGFIAEEIYAKEKLDELPRRLSASFAAGERGGRDDLGDAVDAAKSLLSKTVAQPTAEAIKSEIERGEAEAIETLTSEWQRVTEIAERLNAKHRIWGTEITSG